MDCSHHTEKLRKKNQKIQSKINTDLFGLNYNNQRSTSDLVSSSRLGNKKFSADCDGYFKHWLINAEGFPPGITVDELKKYSRRRQLSHLKPQDNLQIEKGSLKPLKSEYKHHYQTLNPLHFYQALNTVSANLENSTNQHLTHFLPEYKVSYIEYPRKRPIIRRPPNNLEPMKNFPIEAATENNSQFVIFPQYERRKLLRRSTALKPEGEMTNETEIRQQYKKYSNPKRAQMVRHLPSLKLEGEFEPMTTEQQDKFTTFLVSRRPVLEKRKTLLKMEGDFDFLTEKKLSYVPYENSERPSIRKRSTSLKLDGEVEFFPEYRKSYVDFPRTRPITYKPNGSLRNEGELEKDTETKTKFINFENVSTPGTAKPENNLQVEGKMEILPEYKNNFVDFPRERPFLRKPLNQIKPEGNLRVLSESSQSYPELPIVKTEALKCPNNLKLEGEFSFLSENSEKFKKFDNLEKTEPAKLEENLKLEGSTSFVTEKADKFGFLKPETEVTITGRRPSSLKLEGEFMFLPEYKKSFVDFRNPGHFLKPLQNIQSNPSSPRKKIKEKCLLDTPNIKKNSKKLKENLSATEKNLKFFLPDETSLQTRDFCDELVKLKSYGAKSNHSMKKQQNLKDYPAFQVLDVKGQTGCQSMKKEIFDGEKSTSEDDDPTYRLEVMNTDKSGFHEYDHRVRVNSGISATKREEAEKRARERADNYVKIVKQPMVPNYLLEENINKDEKHWNLSGKLSPLPSTCGTTTKPAFVVLNEESEYQGKSNHYARKNEKNWDVSEWINSTSTA